MCSLCSVNRPFISRPITYNHINTDVNYFEPPTVCLGGFLVVQGVKDPTLSL